MNTIGDRIALLRAQLGLSGEQLAERLGLTKGTVSQWETNRSVPKYEHLKRLRQLIDFSYDWLYEGTHTDKPYELTPEALTVAYEWQALESDKRAAYKTLLDLDTKYENANENAPENAHEGTNGAPAK